VEFIYNLFLELAKNILYRINLFELYSSNSNKNEATFSVPIVIIEWTSLFRFPLEGEMLHFYMKYLRGFFPNQPNAPYWNDVMA
jgi:hypothetical protein